MRTVFVNPSHTRKAKRRNPGATSNALVKSYERGLAAGKRANPAKRRRRRNAGVAPFIRQSNPLILENPRRRRRHRNPLFGGVKMDMQSILNRVVATGGGAAIGAAANILGFNKIENVWFRNGARIAAAVFAGALIPSPAMAAAAGGAVLYPTMQELALTFMQPTAATDTAASESASIDHLAADLEAMLEDADLNY